MHATTMVATSKDPSKMSKAQLLQLYTSTAAARDDLTKKYGQYLHVFHVEASCITQLMLLST